MKESEKLGVKKSFSLKGDADATVARQSSTSRIAKNTLFLYFRQILIMLVYRCRFSRGESEADWSGKLRCVTEGGRGVFIGDVCDEVVSMEELGYERVELGDANWQGRNF